ncbi:MAG: glycosyltransferase family 39 protein [Acidobacteriota bacterium]
MALLFLVSLALRCLALGAVTWADVPLLYDEATYFDRAVAFSQIYGDLARGRAPEDEVWQRAYGEGHWPPLHAMLLALGLTIAGPTVAAARFVMTLVAAATTPLVFHCTRQLAGTRTAWVAAGIFSVYPTLLAFSHYLWSETTAIFVLLVALHWTLRAAAASEPRRVGRHAALAGAALGLASLTRAPNLPFLLVVPMWLAARRGQRHGRLAAAATFGAGLLMLLPWQALAGAQEGRFVPVSTLGGYNLALGNNPWVPEGYGSSWGHEPSKARLHAELRDLTEDRSISWGEAGYILARQEILARPGAFLRRSLTRLRMLWAPDFFPARHGFHAVYPPLAPTLAGALFLLSTVFYFALLVLAVIGLASRAGLAHRSLLLALVASGMLLPAATLSISRLHLPLMVLLLPACAHGLCRLLPRLRQPGTRPGWTVWAAGLLLPLALVGTVPRLVEAYLLPSSHYAPVIERLPGVQVTYSDRLAWRWSGKAQAVLRFRLLEPSARLPNGTPERSWVVGPLPRETNFSVWSDSPWEIEITSSSHDRPVRLRPIAPPAWRAWQPSGIPGLEYQWTGGGLPPT